MLAFTRLTNPVPQKIVWLARLVVGIDAGTADDQPVASVLSFKFHRIPSFGGARALSPACRPAVH